MKQLASLILSFCLSPAIVGYAQAPAMQAPGSADTIGSPTIRPVTMIVSARIGQGTVQDTYLTPLEYKGSAMSLQLERWRTMRSQKLTNQQLLTIDYAMLNENTNIGDTWAGRIRYRYALHFKPYKTSHYQLLVGPYAGAELGFNYNLKLANSNNPATVRSVMNLGVSTLNTFCFKLWKQNIAAHLQLQAPLLGTTFTQDYGASYYETFYLDSSDDGFHVTSLHNLRDLDILAAVDVPIAIIPWFRNSTSTLRLGWQRHYESTRINHIQTKFATSQFVIGWVYDYLPFHRTRHSRTQYQGAW